MSDDKLKQVKRALEQEEGEFKEREKKLQDSAPSEGILTPDQMTQDKQHQHNPVEKNANFDKKVYMFPEEFNALRVELQTYYPTFFNSVNPELGMSPAWAMVYDAPHFVGMCNGALDMSVHFDSGNVAGICKQFLNGFRKLRGVSVIH